MVLPTSTLAPDVPAVAVGVLVSLLAEPQPASPTTAAVRTTAPTPPTSLGASTRMVPRFLVNRSRRRWLCGCPIDSVGHAQFTPAVPHKWLAVVIEHRLVVAIDGDVVDDVVGDHEVRGTLHCHAPARAHRGDVVPGAHDKQRRVVAVEGLLDALTGDVSVTVLRLCRGDTHGQRNRERDDACRQRPAHTPPYHARPLRVRAANQWREAYVAEP